MTSLFFSVLELYKSIFKIRQRQHKKRKKHRNCNSKKSQHSLQEK